MTALRVDGRKQKVVVEFRDQKIVRLVTALEWCDKISVVSYNGDLGGRAMTTCVDVTATDRTVQLLRLWLAIPPS